jgi:hypothetical protein
MSKKRRKLRGEYSNPKNFRVVDENIFLDTIQLKIKSKYLCYNQAKHRFLYMKSIFSLVKYDRIGAV